MALILEAHRIFLHHSLLDGVLKNGMQHPKIHKNTATDPPICFNPLDAPELEFLYQRLILEFT